jgi:hypothetical protein
MGVALSTCSTCGVSPEYSPAGGTCSGTTASDFGSGSWKAEVCTASVQVGPEMPAVSMSFAGITSQKEFFIPQDCAGNNVTASLSEGILGLGPLDLDTIGMTAGDAYFPELVTKGIADSMAVLLCSTNGFMWFGGYDPSYASGSPQYTALVPLSANSPYWEVDLSDVTLGSTDLGGAATGAVVDTGTFGFLMPTAAFDALTTDLSTNAGATSVFGAGKLSKNFFSQGDCATPTGAQTQAESDAALPPMILTFPNSSGVGSFQLTMPATQSYLLPVPSGGSVTYCGVVADNSLAGGLTILGASVLRANITVLDEGNGRVGFIPQTYCE